MWDFGFESIQCHGVAVNDGGAAVSSSHSKEKFLKSMLRMSALSFVGAPVVELAKAKNITRSYFKTLRKTIMKQAI